MPSHIETLLTTIGLPAEDVTKITTLAAEEQEKFDAAPYVEKVKTNYQTQLQNDPAFFNELTLEKLPPAVKKQVENAGFGRASKIVTDKFLKGIGMTEADIADLPQETRDKIELLIPAISEKYAKTKAGDKQLQNDLIEARKKLESFDGIEEKLKTKYESESTQKITSAIFNAVVIGELSSIPGLKISAADIAKTANDLLQSKFAFERVGDFGIELRNKQNPQLKALKNGSSQELTLKEALNEIAVERGWVDKETKGSRGSGTIKIEPGKDGTLKMFAAPHLQDKISKKIAAEK